MADAWGGSWGTPSAWGVSWGAKVPVPPLPPPPVPAPSVFAGGGGGGPSIHERVLRDMVREVERRKRKRELTFVEALCVFDFDVATALAESEPLDAP
jgi:hypothetical protein